MALPPILITGATGFVGKRLLRRISPGEFTHVYGVGRTHPPTTQGSLNRPEVTWIQADLPSRPVSDEVLASTDTVVHLAATTGKARPASYFATNVTGTRVLLEQCIRQGVRNFLFVSTIAAKFKDLDRYPYARSKREAEEVVAAASMPFTIVRPTVIAGRDGGAWRGLEKLARLPLTPVFGNGKTPIQPIDVDDLVDGLLTVIRERMFANETLELGGPEVVGIEELLRRLRRERGRKPFRIVHLPLRAIRRGLSWIEGWTGPYLPVTAGQLSTFAEDGTAIPNALFLRLEPRMKRVDEMIARTAADEQGT